MRRAPRPLRVPSPGRGMAFVLALVLAFMLAQSASAQVKVVRLGPQPSHALGPAMDFLEDPGGAMTLEQVRAPDQQARFQPVPRGVSGANFGITDSAVWLRATLDLPAGGDPEWLLELAYPPLDRLELWAPGTGGAYEAQRAGDLLPFSQRLVAHRNHVLPLRLAPGQATTVYLRLQSEGTVSAPLTLWRPAALWQADHASYAVLSLYFGLLAGLWLYNLLLFVSVRDRAYLVYVAFVTGMAIAQLALTGLGYQFVWHDQVWWNSVSPPAGLAIASVFGLLFARSFLASRMRMPLLDRLLRAQVVGWVLTLAAALALPYIWSTWMVSVLAPLSVASLVAAGVVSVRRGYAGARYFLTAWAVLQVGAFAMFMHNVGWLPSNGLTRHSLLIGSALEMVLLSFALADRINVARRFKEQARVRIAAEQAMVEALKESQSRLASDIARRKELEEQLRKAMSEREAILNNAVVGIVLSVHRTHEWVNDKFARMLGYPRQVLIGQSSLYIHPDEAAWERFGVEARAALIERGSYVCERQLRRRNGELFWVEMGGSCVRPNDPDSGVIWTFLDITGRKTSERQMQEALEQQKALNELRTRFVAMTSHEFRTPLAAILSAEELLRHYGERLPAAERLEVLDSIAGGVQRMSRMIDRVLLLGKADAQLLEFAPSEVNVAALCRRLVEEVWAQHPDTPCDIAVRTRPGVGVCRCDEKLLRHIFGNLLSNAIKYSPGGGQVRFDVRHEAGELVFEVEDQGIGIPEGEVGHLFESFHRASNVGAIPGTGLGLAIVKNAVQMHGGTIAVRSVPGQGTAFTVRLPVAVPATPPAPDTMAPA